MVLLCCGVVDREWLSITSQLRTRRGIALTSATMCAFQSSSEPKTTNFCSRQDFSVHGKCAWLGDERARTLLNFAVWHNIARLTTHVKCEASCV